MNNEQLSVYLGVTLPEVIRIVMEKTGLDVESATEAFYSSKVYEALSDETTKAWHYGPMTLSLMFAEERETGNFTWPEEAC